MDLTQNALIEGGNNRASIYLAAQNIAINIFKLESEGLRVLANGQGRQLRGLEAYNERRGEEEGKEMMDWSTSHMIGRSMGYRCGVGRYILVRHCHYSIQKQKD